MSSDASLYRGDLTLANARAFGDRSSDAASFSEEKGNHSGWSTVERGSEFGNSPQDEQKYSAAPAAKPQPQPEPETDPEQQQQQQQQQQTRGGGAMPTAAETEAARLQIAVTQHRIVLAEAQRSGGALFKAGRMQDALLQFATAIEAIRELMIITESVGQLAGDETAAEGMADTERGWQRHDAPDRLVLPATLLDVLEVRAIAHYNLGDYHSALRDALHCITLDGTRLAGYLRAARALQKLGRLEEAEQCMLAATRAQRVPG
jgi:tetratricopeptide (TPR) repeat protein